MELTVVSLRGCGRAVLCTKHGYSKDKRGGAAPGVWRSLIRHGCLESLPPHTHLHHRCLCAYTSGQHGGPGGLLQNVHQTMVEKMGAPDGSKQVVNSQRKDPANHPQPVCDTYKAK
eukprot:scaffold189906_cov19-Tisochrysis_lutea.AAC.3